MSDLRLGNDEASKVIRRMLDLNAARQKTAVKNLANIDTEGYQPKRVEFADHLDQATGRVEMARTAPGHMAGRTSGPAGRNYIEVVDEEAVESPEIESSEVLRTWPPRRSLIPPRQRSCRSAWRP